MAEPVQSPRRTRWRVDGKVWLAIGFGVLSLLSIPAVQWVTRRLPLVPLGKWPSVYLSVVVAFVLASTGLYFASVYLRRIEEEPEEGLLPTSVVFFGLVLLLAGFVFASVADFAKPRNRLWTLPPALIVLCGGVAAYFLLSSRGRQAFTSETAHRIGLEVLRYSEVFSVAALILAASVPSSYDRLKALFLLYQGVIVSPLPLYVSYSLNRRTKDYRSMKCRLRSYAVALPFPVLAWVLLPTL